MKKLTETMVAIVFFFIILITQNLKKPNAKV